MGDSNESEKSPLLATESTATYSEDVIGEFINIFFFYKMINPGCARKLVIKYFFIIFYQLENTNNQCCS